MKEDCINFALKYKQETSKFPTANDWIVKNGFPCSRKTINNLFGSYNNFRVICGEPILVRKGEPTLGWLKDNSVIDENQCWNLNKSSDSDGYRKINYKKISRRAHIVSYLLFHNLEDIPENFIILHKCNNKKCCNPNHLQLGTREQNALDFRPYHKGVKLTETTVKEIRADISNWDFSIKGKITEFDSMWASKLEVNRVTIQSVRLNKSWNDVSVV